MKQVQISALALSLLFIICMALPACTSSSTTNPTQAQVVTELPTTEPNATSPANRNLILATTTSTQDSGLLDIFIPAFEHATGYTVQVVAVGSGEALKMGEQGNADVLLVHDPVMENTFMDDNFGSDRRLVMHNYFIVVGPTTDPAGISTATSVENAFTKIAASGEQFISRGDASGTNAKELSLWAKVGITPTDEPWYLETGQGMGNTLTVASEKAAYTLTDRATFLKNQSNLQLSMLYQNDADLLNAYHVIVVNPERWPAVNNTGAIAFADFITSIEGQQIIFDYGKEQFGQPLFTPDAGKTDADLGLQ